MRRVDRRLRKYRKHGLAFLVTVAGPGLPGWLQACSVCYGDPSSPQIIGANNAVLFLLLVVVGVLSGFAGFFLYLMRRARLYHEGALSGGDSPVPEPGSITKEPSV